MVDTAEALTTLIARACEAEAVALDTEFVWERTYYPRLGVIQLGLGEDDVHLLDAPALDDLTPLGTLLADPSVVKVLHDAVQDLTILRRATGALPQNIFDTQRAAGFIGLSSTISLQDLFIEMVGITLPKGATRTNWLQRPLSDTQRDYAEDDVRYLLTARQRLLDRAVERDRTAWIEEEMQRYAGPAQYADPDPREQGARVKGRGLGRLSPSQRAVLRELAAWREEEAQQRDVPRRRVLEDEALIEIAQRRPDRPERIEGKGIRNRERERFGRALVEAVRRGLSVPPEERPARAAKHPDEDRITARTLVLQAFVAGRCAREELDAGLIATRADLKALTEDGPEATQHAVLQGWRRTFIGEDLLALLRGEGAVSLDGPKGWPQLVAKALAE
ncbi:MAG: ribonuclease D [Rhodothermaceae bacterium]|nr:ribonuclease D [Rhodothermaceae bacterium]